MNYSRFLSKVSAARQPSPTRVLTALLQRSPPSMISMATGMPNTEMFPFHSAKIRTMDGSSFEVDSNLMKRALQYSATNGFPELLNWMKEMQNLEHNPPTSNYSEEEGQLDLIVTTGSQDGLCKTFEMVLSPGDSVLTEAPTYSGTLAILRPLGVNILGVKTDANGLVPSNLETVMSKWRPEDARNSVGGMPKVLYCIPNGGNPTGTGITLERKKQIYEIARKYDLLIVEDDPYYFLSFVKPRIPSFLSMDVDGRVLRFDSFSKILSSGMRVGFVTGPKPLIDRIVLHMQASVMHTSSFTQALVYKLLDTWGHDKFQEHVDQVSDFYLQRRDCIIRSASKWLTGLADWNEPSGGMFLWMKLHGVNDTYQMIMKRAVEKEVLFVPGNAFAIDDRLPSSYIRAAYSLCTPQDMDKGMERLADLIKEEIHLQNKN